MNILASFEWIKEYLDVDATARVFADEMSLKSMSVEKIDDVASRYDRIVVGEVEEIIAHPDADKLKIAITNIGTAYDPSGENVEIVCGGRNLVAGMRVAVALPGSKVRWHGEGELVELGEAKIRGVASCGMICAPEEIGFEKAPCVEGGIWDLSGLVDADGGTSLADALNLHETVFDLEVTTNRVDAMSIVGLAREAAAAVGGSFKAPAPDEIQEGEGLNIDVDVRDSELCTRYMAVALEGVKVGPSPLWLQKKILLSGHRPINNIVDITNLVLHEYGQPMHAFDYDKLEDGSIVVRRAKDGEVFMALDDNEYKLTTDHLVIGSGERAVAVAGVMGGLDSGVNDATSRIVFEAATFDPVNVRKTARALNLYSDSQLLFEKGLSSQSPELALKRAVELALQVGGEDIRVASAVQDHESKTYEPLEFEFDVKRAQNMIGMDLDPLTMLGYLETLGFTVTNIPGKEGLYDVTVPHWRDHDIEHDIDLIEEVARMYGYGNLPSKLPESAPPQKSAPHALILEDNLKRLLQSAGYTELYSNSLLAKEDLEKYGLEPENAVQLFNPLSSELTHMRTSLMPSLLLAVKENQKREQSARVFELSRTYTARQDDLPIEATKLVIAQFNINSAREAFLELKGTAEYIASEYGVKFAFDRLEGDEKWHNTRSASILHDGKNVGTIGQVSGDIQGAFGIDRPVMALELDLEALTPHMRITRVYKEIQELPTSTRDIAIQLESTAPFGELATTVRKADERIVQVNLVEEYTGDPIPEGQKSITLSITIQPQAKTLSSEEIDHILSTATKRLQKAFNATLR